MIKNVKQLLPKGSKEIIIKALRSYQHSLHVIGSGRPTPLFDDNMNNEHFDCYGLIGMMNYDVEITLSKQDVEDFGQHNVDFPEFGEVKRIYPTEISNYTIKKEVFLNWYFNNDYEDYAEVGKIVVQKLIDDEEKFTVEYSIMEIFESCNHEVVPAGLTEECKGFRDKELGELDNEWNLTLI
tara:strand:+ start:55002 stop:55547 length:546 start_codon:yes stop_codon:yes gene_type:complete